MKLYTYLNLSLKIDPAIGEFIDSVLTTSDNDARIEPFELEKLNEYYLDSHDVYVLKYLNRNGTGYYGVRGKRLLDFIPNWTDIRDLLVSKGVEWQLGEPPESPEMICNNYGSVPHSDLARNTALNFIVHEDTSVPFYLYNNEKTIISTITNCHKGFLYNAKTIHGTGEFKEKNIRVIVTFCIMDTYEEMLQKLDEYVI